MATPDPILKQLRAIVGAKNVLTKKEDLIPYSFDGTAALKATPGCVVFVKDSEQIAGILKLANESGPAGMSASSNHCSGSLMRKP